ncbi:putative transcription factor interactor and regulator CCHC(Zn) family [Helianthus annuus]|nr:putative transcription factor interactor and regulator CCHC(Zn) family [Helianthus annuus]KAJ0552553.1 putative transcription factor interactor and regulator CCHC(Zn) family [Helianthus annuus]KAJ0718249.1 putative transcription factor interactor and regulator CCHC(Zn) family [Helianthus annuus]
MIEDANKKAYYGIIDQDDEKMAAGFSWDRYVQENPHLSSAFVAQILEETSVKSKPKRIPIFPELGVDADTDDEEEYIEKTRRGLDTDSFNLFFFAEKIEMLKEKRVARLKREWKETEARKAVEEKAKVEVEKAEVEESSTKEAEGQKAEIESEEPMVEKMIEKIVEVEEVIEKIVEFEKIVEIEKLVEIEKVVEVCKQCEEKDKKIRELEQIKENLLSDVKYVKESYDVLNKIVDGLKKNNLEVDKVMTMMSSTLMTKQKVINDYIEDCVKLKQDLDLEKIESERIKRLLLSYTTCDYLIDRVYPTVAGLEAFKEEKTEDTDTGKKHSVKYNKCSPPIYESYAPRKPNEERLNKALNIKLKSETIDELPDNIDVTFTASDTDHESELVKKVVDQVLDTDEESKSESKSESSSSSEKSPSSPVKRVYNKEFLLSKNNLNDEMFKVAYTLNDSDKLFSDEEFSIRGVKPEIIKNVFKLTEINISEIKDENLYEKPRPYTSRIKQKINKKMGYNCGYGFQKKANHNSNFKKKGLGFIPPENYKNQKTYKSKIKFVSGGCAEEEQKKPFWRQSNQEFLAEKKKNLKKFTPRVDRRTCFKCQEVGHIAWNCSKSTYTKHGVSSNFQLRKTMVDKTEQTLKNVKMFENSTYEEGERSKHFYKRKGDLNKQKWVAKSESNSDNESDSIKSEESLVEKKSVNSVPEMNDENFPKLSKENLKLKVGKVEISDQFFTGKGEFDVEKAFNGKVKHIFGKMVDRKVKGAK